MRLKCLSVKDEKIHLGVRGSGLRVLHGFLVGILKIACLRTVVVSDVKCVNLGVIEPSVTQ